MIRGIERLEIPECVRVIRESFGTVAEELGFHEGNAPRFTAFATTEDRLLWHMEGEHRLMFAFHDQDRIVGYYSLHMVDGCMWELSNLCVLPGYRHNGIGSALLQHAVKTAREQGCQTLQIGIVEENRVLRKWYEDHGFNHTGIRKFDFFPFTCGYMECCIE